MNDLFKVRAWIIAEKRMIDCVELSPFHVGDCDRLRWKRDEVILMQCAGFPDKNGRLIYEGDVVSYDEDREYTGTVAWDESELEWGIDDRAGSCRVKLGCYHSIELEIIGNRYDNPELMEGNNG